MVFRVARRDDLLAEDPSEFVATVRSRKSSEGKRPFTIAELRDVLSVADPEWRSLVLFGLYTGQRLGDLARLRWSNIDLARNQYWLVTSKTGKSIRNFLPGPLRRHIEGLPSSDAPASLRSR